MRHIPADVIEAIRNDRLIEAIRAWRDFTGDDLRTSKEFIDANREAIKGLSAGSQRPPKDSPPTMEKDLPKQELLLKMLNMTTVAEDTMAVVAIRKANALLREAGWTWEKLLSGKIVVVEDPFSKIKAPEVNRKSGYGTTVPPRAPQQPDFAPPPPRPVQRPAPAPAPPPRPQPIFTGLSSKKNVYPGFCYGCGDHVPHEKGFVMRPRDWNPSAPDKWLITCIKCNQSKWVNPSAAPKKNGSWTATPTGKTPDLGSL